MLDLVDRDSLIPLLEAAAGDLQSLLNMRRHMTVSYLEGRVYQANEALKRVRALPFYRMSPDRLVGVQEASENERSGQAEASTEESRLTGLRQLQREIDSWVLCNWPDTRIEHQALTLAEECGELCHHVVKQAQGRCGDPGEHEAGLRDAVGDIVISLLAVCAMAGLVDPEEAIRETWAKVRNRDWRRFPRNGVNE